MNSRTNTDKSKWGIPKYFLESIAEFVITMLYSLAPMIVGVTLIYGSGNESSTLLQALRSELGGGELFLWSLTILATIAYSICKSPPVKFRVFFIVYCILVMLLSVSYKAIVTFDRPQDSFISISYVLGIASAIVLYINMYLNHKANNIEAPVLQQRQVTEFQNEFELFMDDLK